MADLSPAAQAVLDAAINVAESPDAEAIAAAVLRAAASQFDRPKRSDAHTLWNEGFQYTQNVCRAHLLNIADELEGASD